MKRLSIGECDTMKAINNLSSTEFKWFAVYTKYKAEKYVVKSLAAKKVEAYVPLISYTKRYLRKIKTYNTPLINCYVFVKILKEDYVKVLETEHVMRFLKIKNDLIAIPESEIELMKRVVGEVNEIEVSHEFLDGDEVEIVAGQLTGLKGKLLKKESRNNFLIELQSVGLQMRIHIDPEYLIPVRNHIFA